MIDDALLLARGRGISSSSYLGSPTTSVELCLWLPKLIMDGYPISSYDQSRARRRCCSDEERCPPVSGGQPLNNGAAAPLSLLPGVVAVMAKPTQILQPRLNLSRS